MFNIGREMPIIVQGTRFDTMIKSIKSYSSTEGTLIEDVCSRLIKLTTQVYLGNVGLLTD